MSVLGETLKDNKPARYAITGILVASSVLIAYWAGKKVIAGLKKSDSKKEIEELEKETNPNKIYKTDAELLGIANSIFSGLDYSAGIRLDVIEQNLAKLKSADEWKKLVSLFGKRKATATFSWFEGNLPEWLNYKLNFYSRPRVQAILSKIGVTL